jgi:hypothetical protein
MASKRVCQTSGTVFRLYFDRMLPASRYGAHRFCRLTLDASQVAARRNLHAFLRSVKSVAGEESVHPNKPKWSSCMLLFHTVLLLPTSTQVRNRNRTSRYHKGVVHETPKSKTKTYNRRDSQMVTHSSMVVCGIPCCCDIHVTHDMIVRMCVSEQLLELAGRSGLHTACCLWL